MLAYSWHSSYSFSTTMGNKRLEAIQTIYLIQSKSGINIHTIVAYLLIKVKWMAIFRYKRRRKAIKDQEEKDNFAWKIKNESIHLKWNVLKIRGVSKKCIIYICLFVPLNCTDFHITFFLLYGFYCDCLNPEFHEIRFIVCWVINNFVAI